MKLSLRFFYTKIAKRYPAATLLVLPGKNPSFSSLGIITDGMVPAGEVVYIDLIAKGEGTLPEQASVITTEARAPSFKRCNLIVLPDGTDLAEVTQLVSSTFTHYFGWADTLYEAIAKNVDLQTIIDITAPILKNPIYLADSSFKMLASWGGEFGEVNPTWSYQEKYRYLPYQVMQALIESGELKKLYNTPQAWRVTNSPGFTALPYISKAIRKEGVHYGNFYIIEFYNLLDACDLEIANYLGKILSTALYGNLNYLEKSTLYHAHFLEDIIEGTLTDKQIMVDQLRALHWEMEGDYILALFDASEDNDAIKHHMMALLTTDLDAQCLGYHGDVLVILNSCSKRMEKISHRLGQVGRDFNRTVALSERFVDFSQIGKYYEQARFTLDIADPETEKGHLLSYDDAFFIHLATEVEHIVPAYTPALKLQRYDSEHDTELCLTLLTWLTHERNSVKTAETLYIHRNTLKNRLERIKGIIEIDLDDFEKRMRLMLSLYTLELQAPRTDMEAHDDTD